MADVRIVKTGAERIDDLAPLWKALQSYHRAIGADVPGIPLRDPEDSWARRRAEYAEWLALPGSFILLALDGSHPIGYALVAIHEPGDDTHVTRERWAELESLSVAPEHRGTGIGTRILERVYEELRAEGVRELLIGVLVANVDAARLYERHGFRPWLTKYLGVVPGSEQS